MGAGIVCPEEMVAEEVEREKWHFNCKFTSRKYYTKYKSYCSSFVLFLSVESEVKEKVRWRCRNLGRYSSSWENMDARKRLGMMTRTISQHL